LRAWLAPNGDSRGPVSRGLTSVLDAISSNAIAGLSLLTSAYSIVVGTIFLLGAADKLPSLT